VPRDAGHRPARLQEPHGSSTPPLQLLWSTRGAHRPVNYLSIISATIGSEKPGFVTTKIS
jgi:hypothetical protein